MSGLVQGLNAAKLNIGGVLSDPKINKQSVGNCSSQAMLWRTHVAAETGARFVRERIDRCPVAWMFQPSELFRGRSPIEDCNSWQGYGKAMLFHGLSLSFDARSDYLESLPAANLILGEGGLYRHPPRMEFPAAKRGGNGTSLFTCTISASLGSSEVLIFCAMIANGEEEVRTRLRQRYGSILEDEALVRRGFDWSEPLACAMVSDAMGEMLTLVDDDPTSPIAEGLDFQVEQRFAG